MPSDSEGNNCASEATQILRLNNEQNLRYLNIFWPTKSNMSKNVNKNIIPKYKAQNHLTNQT